MKSKSHTDENRKTREMDTHSFKKTRRGRPPMPEELRKHRTTIMLDRDIVATLKKDGRGWQTRLNAILRKSLNLD